MRSETYFLFLEKCHRLRLFRWVIMTSVCFKYGKKTTFKKGFTSGTYKRSLSFWLIRVRYSCESSGTHGGDYEDESFLAYHAEYSRKVDGCFWSGYRLHHQGDHHLCNIGLLPLDYTTLHPRKLQSPRHRSSKNICRQKIPFYEIWKWSTVIAKSGCWVFLRERVHWQ